MGRPPHFVVEFHSYTDLTHTIRLRQYTAHVRLSDILRDAPQNIVEAAAAMLLGRLYRRRPPREMVEAYRSFSYEPSTRSRLLLLRQRRAKRIEHRPAGAYHDLEPLFQQLNERYFDNSLVKPGLGWSSRPWRRQLGCYDPALNQIVINRQLDRPNVPGYVVTYILYHEMLHQKHPAQFVRCRRASHTAQFRAEEKVFADYRRATQFLKHFPAR
jgi:hypothetical protein